MRVSIRFLVLLTVGWAVVSPPSYPGESAGEGGEESPPRRDQAGPIIEKIRGSIPLSGGDIRKLDGTMVRVEETIVNSCYIEGGYPEKKKVYLLKVEKESEDFRDMVIMQKSLLRSQLVLLKTLEVIVRHQAELEHRLARNENMMRDMIMGEKDASYCMNMIRGDTSSTSAGVGDLSEMTVDISNVVGEIKKMVSEPE